MTQTYQKLHVAGLYLVWRSTVHHKYLRMIIAVYLTYESPYPNDIFVHQSTPYVPTARLMPNIINTPMITMSPFSGYTNEDGEKFTSDFTAAIK